MEKQIIQTEAARSILGVNGRAFNVIRHYDRPGIASQEWKAQRTRNGEDVAVNIRFDDNCKNGHSTFAITGDIYTAGKPRTDRNWLGGGACHERIAEVFPELAPLIKWHLVSVPGPIHYFANVLYFAGERDHWGLLKGEAHPGERHQETRVRFGSSPITHPVNREFAAWLRTRPEALEIVAVPHKNRDGTGYKFADKYTFEGFPREWHTCPFDSLSEAEEWREALSGPVEFSTHPTLFGEGKARELDKARSAAIWPEATDEELSQDPAALREALAARLPALIEAFRRDMVEVCGFIWEADD